MSELRPFALLRTPDQWIRSSFDHTVLDLSSGVVELQWTTARATSTLRAPALAASLAFDNECRLYHSLPDAGQIQRALWAAQDPAKPLQEQSAPVNLMQVDSSGQVGAFSTPAEQSAPLAEPRGLAVDLNDRLFVAESGADRILVYDLWSDRLLRKLTLPGARPTALAANGINVYAVLSGTKRIVELTARSDPSEFELPAGCTDPSRIAIAPAGRIAILEKAASLQARVWFVEPGLDDFAVPFATDLAWESDGVIVVARQPEADFLRYQIGHEKRSELPSLRARGYDGLGIVATPQVSGGPRQPSPRRIGYWSERGLRNAVPARLLYERAGRVTTFALDSGGYQTVWGRLFVDACIPEGTDLRVNFAVLDEIDDEQTMARVPPPNVEQAVVIRPDLSPPMLPITLAPGPDDVIAPLHRRESGREIPWSQPPADDPFQIYEAPINAPAGRFLWITFELRGNTRVSPKIRCVRAEHPSHDYLRRLPRTFSRQAQAASFLLRYLAMFEGFLGETEARAVDRAVLLNPDAAPDEVIPWLASFVGLVLDERWAIAPSADGNSTVDARRELIAQAAWLFRYRGTLPGLKRFIEIYVGTPIIIIEHFRLRGIGGAILGDQGSAMSTSVLGAGFRVGGAISNDAPTAIDGTVDDAFRTHAHRFTVIVPAPLNQEQFDVVRHILEVHRPAHTIFELCTVEAGMRVGRGLMLELSSVIGPSGGFATLQAGGSALGRGAIVGRPELGTVLGSARVGRDSSVG